MSEVPEKDRASVAAVAALAHEMAELINALPRDEREGVREDAVGVLREEVEMSRPAMETAAPEVAGTFNPFGIGIPLILMGTVLVFLFPPVGLVMFAVAAVVVAWGIGATLIARR